ncbi:MAG: AmmeMemoRadiSam system radical SAM enzyme [Methanomassiliicoccales archaeon]|nr:AmmeMemoRadiSam system radical SAM enzyme [Methanomassiliicoccales archaeon]
MKEARFWKSLNGKIQCCLCPHSCVIAPGKKGICGVRQNYNGKLFSLIYGKASSIHVDPIEKKPFFHFRPGDRVLSFGSVGCTFRCQHCQNFTISQASPDGFPLEPIEPEEVTVLCRNTGSQGISWTYNEPIIWHEFAYDASRIAKQQGFYALYVTNGYIEEEPLRELSQCIDGMNIDIKGFSEEFYKRICKASLEPVLKATKLAVDLGIHVELTYLIIPGKNDSEGEIKEFAKWVRDSLKPEIPVHFTRFHPDYMMTDVPSTPMKTMEMALHIGKEEGLKFVYLGNVPRHKGENTYCPKCGQLAIEREGFQVLRVDVDNGRCRKCGEPLNIII